MEQGSNLVKGRVLLQTRSQKAMFKVLILDVQVTEKDKHKNLFVN